MKKILTVTLLILSTNLFSQDTIPIKKLSLGVGVSKGTIGWGENTNLSYSVSKKILFKLRFIYGLNNETNCDKQYYGIIERLNSADVSISANYYLLGNTKTSKAGLYIGFGLGYLNQAFHQTYLYPGYYNGVQTSYLDKDLGQGLTGNLSIGASVKLGPGKLYAEGYFSMAFLDNETETLTSYSNYPSPNINNPPPTLHVYKDYDRLSIRNGYVAILCLNVGYAIPF